MSIDLDADYLDTRQIWKEVEELESLIESYQEDIEEYRVNIAQAQDTDERMEAEEDLKNAENWIKEHIEELKPLKEFVEEYEDEIDDFMYGATLISDDAFVNYTKMYASEFCLAGIDIDSWPFNYIDWEEAAEAFQSDFTNVEIGDHTFWVRS